MPYTKRFSHTAAVVMVALIAGVVLVGFAPAATPPPASMLTMTPSPTEPEPADSAGPVSIRFLGRSSFLIVAPDGQRFVTDPFYQLPIPFPEGIEADAVVISHAHIDHFAYWLVEGNPVVVMGEESWQFGLTTITGYPSRHGEYGDGQTGDNTIFVFQIGDVKLVHLGDFGEIEDDAVYDAIRDADVVFVPISEIAGIPQHTIMPFMEEINAGTVVPMHWFYPGEGATGGTLRSFRSRAADKTDVIDMDELLVEPGMPYQVVVLPEWLPEN